MIHETFKVNDGRVVWEVGVNDETVEVINQFGQTHSLHIFREDDIKRLRVESREEFIALMHKAVFIRSFVAGVALRKRRQPKPPRFLNTAFASALSDVQVMQV